MLFTCLDLFVLFLNWTIVPTPNRVEAALINNIFISLAGCCPSAYATVAFVLFEIEAIGAADAAITTITNDQHCRMIPCFFERVHFDIAKVDFGPANTWVNVTCLVDVEVVPKSIAACSYV